MEKGRLEAFSDGVLAIVITIMVLELKVPHGSSLDALRPVVPVFLSYLLSFINIGIYWNNHHHLLHATHKIGGAIMWANLHLLFWLSLIPVTTAWIGGHPRAAWPTALYGMVLLLAALAWILLERAIIRLNGPSAKPAGAQGQDLKGKISLGLYLAAVALSFVRTWLADLLYATVAILWIVPDPRIEKRKRAR